MFGTPTVKAPPAEAAAQMPSPQLRPIDDCTLETIALMSPEEIQRYGIEERLRAIARINAEATVTSVNCNTVEEMCAKIPAITTRWAHLIAQASPQSPS